MEAVNEVNTLNEITKDRPRPEARRLVEIECGPNSLIVPGGHLLKRGTNRLYMYESDIARCQELVAEQAVFDEARQRYEARKAAFLKQERANRRDDSLTWDDVAEDFTGPATVAAYLKFDVFHGGTLPPLRAIRYVDEEEYPPPKTDAAAMAEQNSKTLARTIREALGESAASSELAALKAELAELREELRQSKRPGRKN